MKMRLLLATTLLVLTAGIVAICVYAMTNGGTHITANAYQRIQVGMTRQQVEDILGGPPRNESGVIVVGTACCRARTRSR
jgi:outer membrane protein assembly factor BamE (lipoprotein component of BamABCDE complex)